MYQSTNWDYAKSEYVCRVDRKETEFTHNKRIQTLNFIY